MLWQSSYFLLCLLMLNQINVSFGITCNPGEKVAHSNDKCEPCPKDQYNPRETKLNECHNCDPCELYSKEITRCTSQNNTVCKCFPGFIPFPGNKQRRCYCDHGHGIKTIGNGEQICDRCPSGTSTDKINQMSTECKPKSAVKFPGDSTPDVNGRKEVKPVVSISSPCNLSQTSRNISAITPTSSRNLDSTPTTSIPAPQGISKHPLWLASLAAFVLLVLILKLCRCPEKKTDIVRQGSACGKPVEESGEKFI